MTSFVALLRRVVDADTSLLFLGETGVGKEWFAKAVHGESRRSNGPFIPVNCAGIPEGLLDSELFGHEAGAFTGATRMRRGLFELAEGGVLFLDEVGEMPLHLQTKLLRVLQDHRIQRLGSERSQPVDVRILAATNCDLRQAVRRGEFREDLFYRIGVVSLTVPTLRERREDIPSFIRTYVTEFANRFSRPIMGVSEEALEILVHHTWPGNVRELINTIERAVLLCDESWILPIHLPAMLVHGGPPGEADGVAGSPVSGVAHRVSGRDEYPLSPGHGSSFQPVRPLKDARAAMLADWERAYLKRCLAECRGHIQEAAQLADINPRSLREMMRRHGLSKEEFRMRKGPNAK